MSKTLVANPLWGLKGIPTRIILDKKSLTIKNGIIGGKSMPYNSIDAPGAIDVSVKESPLAKYNNYLGMLKASYPNNKLIPFFESKIPEWKQKDKEHTKMLFKYLIYMAIAFVVLFFITTRCMH